MVSGGAWRLLGPISHVHVGVCDMVFDVIEQLGTLNLISGSFQGLILNTRDHNTNHMHAVAWHAQSALGLPMHGSHSLEWS